VIALSQARYVLPLTHVRLLSGRLSDLGATWNNFSATVHPIGTRLQVQWAVETEPSFDNYRSKSGALGKHPTGH